MKDEMTLKCGVTLHLQAVNPDALFHLYSEMGFYDAVARTPSDFDGTPEEWAAQWGTELDFEDRIGAAQKTEQLFNYCCGWGVTDSPPPKALTELRAIGLPTGNERQARINWLRFLLLEEDEAGELIGQVMALSQMARIARIRGDGSGT